MLIFETLTLQNFLSYGNDTTTINLNVSDPVLITGINMDSSVGGELDSNGSGKSTILNGIAYAIYGRTISVTSSVNELINNINKKDMVVSLTLKNDNDRYRIHRYRANKAMGGNGVLIEKLDGSKWVDITTTKADQQIINDIVKIPFVIFNRIVGYAAGEEPFLRQSLSAQREIIDELFGYTELMSKADKLKEVLKEYKSTLSVLEVNDEANIEYNLSIENNISNMTNKFESWEVTHAEKIKAIQSKLDNTRDIDFEAERSRLESISELVDKLHDLNKEKDSLSTELSSAKKSTDAFNNFDSDLEKQINGISTELSEILSSGIELSEQIDLLQTKAVLNESVGELTQELKNVERGITSTDRDIKKCEDEISSLSDSKCPYCDQQFVDAKDKMLHVEERLLELSSTKDAFTESLNSIQSELSNKNVQLSEATEQLLFDNMEELNSFKNSISTLETKLEYLKNTKNPHQNRESEFDDLVGKLSTVMESIDDINETIKRLKESSTITSLVELERIKIELENSISTLESLKVEVNPYSELLDELNNTPLKPRKSDEIDEMLDNIKHCDFLIKLLTKKDSFIRKALMDKYLPMLNTKLGHYLKIMSLPHKVLFNSDLSTEISQFDRTIPYGNLSAGQRARVNIALSLAFRDVLQSKHNFTNLFILDECLDVGLSNVGVKNTVTAIKEVAEENKLSMFVISHRDEVDKMFDETLTIVLENGFSSIKDG